MFETTSGIMELDKALFWIGATYAIDSSSEHARTSGTCIFRARVFCGADAGVVLAFALQLLLTNLSVAAGISYLGHQSDSSSNDDESGSLGGTIRKIGTAVGIGRW
jgi:hypothetical protein